MLLFHNEKLVKVRIYNQGDGYMAMASNSNCSVWNCFGTTQKKAKEMALFRLNQSMTDEIKELVVDREGYTFYLEK
ncbi:MAG: hypothetical protein K6T88_08815 [Bacillus sp. (in: Bacteria)]|nr:hypothetical protein [Bacillus sp. (in: firmicutes)]